MSKISEFNLEKARSVLLPAAAIVVIVWGLIEAKRFLVTMFGAILFALLLMPLMRFLKNRRLPEWACLLISSTILILPIVLIAGAVVSEAHSILTNWPKIQDSLTVHMNAVMELPWFQNLMNQLGIESPIEQIGKTASESIHLIMQSVLTLFSVGTEFSLMLFFAVVMLGSRKHIRNSLDDILKFYRSPEQAHLMDASTNILEKFLAARMIIILSVALVDFVILRSFGLHYAVTVALFLGLSTLIPAIGFFIGIIPPLILAVLEGHAPGSIGLMVFLLWLIASLQDHILAPKLLGQHLNLNFLMTYVAIFMGERLWGVPGMFLSVPILAVIQVLLDSSDQLKPWAKLIQGHEKNEVDKDIRN